MNHMYEDIWNTIYTWQVLVGHFLGVGVPIMFWVFLEIHNGRKKQKEDLYYLEKILAESINTVGEVQKTIRNFTDNRLQEMIGYVERCQKADIYSMDETYFPLFYVHTVSGDVMKINTKSGYLDYKISRVSMLSKDFAMIIDDLRNQFVSIVENNRNIIANKSISPGIQCANYLKNLREFNDVVETDLFNRDVKKYLEVLVCGRVAVRAYMDFGYFRWNYHFSPSFKYFRDKAALNEYKDTIFERLDGYFDERNKQESDRVERQLSKAAKTSEGARRTSGESMDRR